MLIANLGAGAKTSDDPSVVSVDWSIYHRINRRPLIRSIATPIFFRGYRRERLESLGTNVVVHNLAKGIPFEDQTVDAVYHSHLLEHLDREVAPGFMAEVHRVLKPGGLHRIAVPDFEKLCREYLADLEASAGDDAKAPKHDESIEAIILQMVRREAYGTSLQSPVKRKIENLVLGGARKRGETHQWMYDHVNLRVLLESTGFADPEVKAYADSAIPGWAGFGLEVNEDGTEYKPESLYMEAIRV